MTHEGLSELRTLESHHQPTGKEVIMDHLQEGQCAMW